jgi:cysteine sulfinate desulfinase/cysteine desulfurase-like protein
MIYLDHNAPTPVLPKVPQAVDPSPFNLNGAVD